MRISTVRLKMKHVRYLSKGNSVGLEDDIEDYWEIDAAGYLERSVHVLPDGTLLKYDRRRAADEHGALPEGVVTAEYLADASYGQTSFISPEEFEAQWSRPAKNEE